MSNQVRRITSKSILWSSQKIHKRNFDKIVKSLDFGLKIWYNIYVPKGER